MRVVPIGQRTSFTCLVVVLAALSILSDANSTPEENPADSRALFKLPKVFDFDYYRTLFHKSYSSLPEELVRRKIYLGRAMRAYVSGVAFKFRRSDYYLATNEQSDLTPAEILKTEQAFYLNDDGTIGYDPKLVNASQVNEMLLAHEPILDVEEIELEFERLMKEEPEQVDEETKLLMKEVRSHGIKGDERHKRSIEIEPRDFSMDKLIDRQMEAVHLKRRLARVGTNNPNYEPPEPTSNGWKRPSLGDLGIKWNKLREKLSGDKRDANGTKTSELRLTEYLGQFGSMKATSKRRSDLRMFVDHTTSDCFNEIQDQHLCGASYAFAASAYFEWLMCKKTGHLVKFSEQYPIDCGPKSELKEYLQGCQGGSFFKMGTFYERYGAELAANYPFTGYDGECSYVLEGKSLNKMGYLRFGEGLSRGVAVNIAKWPDYLEVAPLLVNVGTRGDFHEYGGGVHSGADCCKGMSLNECGRHTMLVVGHGRQDGEEFWLMRNSFSASFGEKGYYKLNVNSDCIHPSRGFMFATKKGKRVKMNILARGT